MGRSGNRSWIRLAAPPGRTTWGGDRISAPRGGQSPCRSSGCPARGHGVVCDAVRILSRYILRQHLVPFLLGFGVVTFIFGMEVVFEYLDLVINRGVPIVAVLKLFALSLGFIVPLSAPCAVLVAELMTFGGRSRANELPAWRASGVHPLRALVPPLVCAAALAAGLTYFNNYVYPEVNHSFAGLLTDIGRMRPTVKLQEGVFIDDFPGYSLLVQAVNGQTNEMRGVTIYQLNAGAPPTTILARSGYLTYTADGRTAVLELQDGEIHEIPREEGGAHRYHRLVFRKHTIYIQGAGALLERTVRSTRGDREKSARALLDERSEVLTQYQRSLEQHRQRWRDGGASGDELDVLAPEHARWWRRPLLLIAAMRPGPHDALDDVATRHPVLRLDADLWRMERDGLRRRAASLSIEIHKKFALPVACVVFVLIGAPIGMRVRRGGPAVAIVSIRVLPLFYGCRV